MTRVPRHIVLSFLTLAWLVPAYLAVVNAAVPTRDYTGTAQWLPRHFALITNMRLAWEQAQLGSGLLNSVIYGAVGAGVAALVALLGGFAIVMMPLRRRAMWFWLLYAGTLFPFQIYLAPLFNGYVNLGIYDTHLGLLAIYAAITVPFAFFVMRNHATTVPRELIEAAMLDGAGWWRILRSIFAPLSKPAIGAVFLFQATWIWNDLLFGISLSQSSNVRPVMAALANLQGISSTVGVPVVLAGALLVSVPTVALFVAFQRLFVQGLRATV
jgi:multiple sugar transport system permease protein